MVDVASGQQPEVKIDPTKELSRLVSEHKYEEAFAMALHRCDVAIVSWLCFQVTLFPSCALHTCSLTSIWCWMMMPHKGFSNSCHLQSLVIFSQTSILLLKHHRGIHVLLLFLSRYLQVDLQRVLTLVPMPLSQGVLLALLQQLACDISNDTSKKLSWMTDVAMAINPADPMIVVHVRPIFDQVYQTLGHHRNLPMISASEASSIRLLMHVINSVLMSCK